MSHSLGEIWSQEGKLLGWFEYNGTCDVACARIYLEEQELHDNWRKDNWRTCKCGSAGQTVILYSSYGNGFHWPATVCWGCLAILEPKSDFWDIATDGHPFFEERLRHGGYIPVCPKCGQEYLESDGGRHPIRCGACGEGFYWWQIPKEVSA